MVFGKYRINFRIPKSSTRNESEKAFYWPQSGTCDQVTGKWSSVD
jgi:hypothetical protein